MQDRLEHAMLTHTDPSLAVPCCIQTLNFRFKGSLHCKLQSVISQFPKVLALGHRIFKVQLKDLPVTRLHKLDQIKDLNLDLDSSQRLSFVA